ncbi:DUF551 domain-containing protein [Acinetobacter baumannii]|uniref:DUF551 domain-containing protein n=1 Tax=Acinetobacter baumannii TaxID=470 RepID=UPI001D189B7C|nr:DUF551 domain-containing protein [Acinetobacter baumannii]
MTGLNKLRSEFEAQHSDKVFKIVKFDEATNAYCLHAHLPLTEINLSALAEINYGWGLWQKAKAQAVPVWISVDDHMPESLRNVLVLLDANPAKNQNQMVAHFIPKFTEEYHGDDDWYDYDEDRGCGYVKEGWYANTAYIGDEYSSYFIEEKVTHWKSLKEESESGAEG